MRIGLFGGSFNPIHNGHLTIGRTMLGAMSLDEVWYMVSPQNPMKQSSNLLDEKIRLELTRVALENDERLVASDYEFHLPRPSFTWKTLQALKEDYPEHEFVIIIGGDNLEDFKKWAHYQEILAQYDIAVFPRKSNRVSSADPAYSLPSPQHSGSYTNAGEDPVAGTTLDSSGHRSDLLTSRVHIINVPLVDVTSTMLRDMLQKGQDISAFVPDKVNAMIVAKHLWMCN